MPRIKKEVTQKYIPSVGRRREAVARVRLYPEAKNGVMLGDQIVKKGEIFVNKRPIDNYFTDSVEKATYLEPFRATNTLGKFAMTIMVAGGGKAGQLAAVIHGIARALSTYDSEKYRKILKKKGLLRRDARTRERRKVGMGGKARRKKQSPKR